MKKNLILVIAVVLTSCSSYHITIMDEKGTVIKEHDTQKMYVGTGAFVPDAVIDPLVMVGSLFYPIPFMNTNISVGGGMTLPRYIGKMSSIAPISFVGNGGGDWITFYDDKGNIVSYNGFNYSLVRKAKFEQP
jgi:hypothetical protein